MMTPSTRIAWIDHLKALGICLVVLGHSAGLPDFVHLLIYSFHMPLFFFVSGYLLKTSHLQQPPQVYLSHLWRTLIIPYIGFWLLSYLYWLVSHSFVLDPSKYLGLTFVDLFSGFVHGTGDPEHTLILINVDLWFFTCLFSTALLHYFLRRWLKSGKLLGAIALLGGCAPLIPKLLGARLPWNIDLAGAALVFYALGHLLRAGRLLGKRQASWWILASLLFWIALSSANGAVDMNLMQFGQLWLFYLAAGAGISFSMLVLQRLPANKLSYWLSANTIVIFPLHQLLFSVFNGIGVRLLGLPTDFKTSLLASLVFTLCALACCYPLALILRRFAPFMIGERRA